MKKILLLISLFIICNSLFSQEVIRILNDDIQNIYKEKPCLNDSISLELRIEFYNTKKCDIFNLINNNNLKFYINNRLFNKNDTVTVFKKKDNIFKIIIKVDTIYNPYTKDYKIIYFDTNHESIKQQKRIHIYLFSKVFTYDDIRNKDTLYVSKRKNCFGETKIAIPRSWGSTYASINYDGIILKEKTISFDDYIIFNITDLDKKNYLLYYKGEGISRIITLVLLP